MLTGYVYTIMAKRRDTLRNRPRQLVPLYQRIDMVSISRPQVSPKVPTTCGISTINLYAGTVAGRLKREIARRQNDKLGGQL